MKAERSFGLDLSWPRLTTVFLIDLMVLVVASRVPDSWLGQDVSWWVGVGVATLVTLLALITYRGITAPSALLEWVRDWSSDPAAALSAGCSPAIDHKRRIGGDEVGVREYLGQLVTVIALDSGEEIQPGLARDRPGVLAHLPVAAVADGLRQFDVHLDGIDIVSVGDRRAADESSARPDSRWEDLAAFDRRRTWLVLRMNPQRNVAAVLTRDSLASTMAAATERLAQNLDARHCRAMPLTADEIAWVDDRALAGLEPVWRRPGCGQLKHPHGYAASFWVSPSDITSENLGQLWQVDVDAAVVVLRLIAAGRRTEISALVRYHSREPLNRDVSVGLNRLVGRQLAAVRASLPVPALRPQLAVSARDFDPNEDLTVLLGDVAHYSISSPTE